jgi:glycerophosphoryl diester phosphodiesterase
MRLARHTAYRGRMPRFWRILLMALTPPTRPSDHGWIRRSRALGRPLIFAHRGGAGLAPENTFAAFDRAHALGVDGFELDVRLSRDGEVVVIHDADVARTTEGFGRIVNMTVDELSRFDAGFRFMLNGDHPFRAAGVRIPRLRELLARYPDELLIIELKGRDPVLAERAVEVVRAAGALDRVCFGGFSWRTLGWARRIDARVCTSASREETRWALYASWVTRGYVPLPSPWPRYQAFQVPEMAGHTRVVSRTFLRAAHARGLLVQVWTVNDEADMRRLIDWGVDGLITDRPDVARRVLDAEARGPFRAEGAPDPTEWSSPPTEAAAPPLPGDAASRAPARPADDPAAAGSVRSGRAGS